VKQYSSVKLAVGVEVLSYLLLVVRLSFSFFAANNLALQTENARIPVLEADLADTQEELATTREQLATAISTIQSLEAALAGKIAELEAANAHIAQLNAAMDARGVELSEARGEIRAQTEVIATKTAELARARLDIEGLQGNLEAKGIELDRAAVERSKLEGTLADTNKELSETKETLAKEISLKNEAITRGDNLSSQLKSLGEEKDVLVTKLTGDLAKVMEELDTVQEDLHKAQDYISYVEPPAMLVINLRKAQHDWDAEHAKLGGGGGAAGATPSKANAAALKKLGPRPTLTL
jgi:chromosome segregation ATPase